MRRGLKGAWEKFDKETGPGPVSYLFSNTKAARSIQHSIHIFDRYLWSTSAGFWDTMREQDRHSHYSYEATLFGGKADTSWKWCGLVGSTLGKHWNTQQNTWPWFWRCFGGDDITFHLRPERWVEIGKAMRKENNIIKRMTVSRNWKQVWYGLGRIEEN